MHTTQRRLSFSFLYLRTEGFGVLRTTNILRSPHNAPGKLRLVLLRGLCILSTFMAAKSSGYYAEPNKMHMLKWCDKSQRRIACVMHVVAVYRWDKSSG